MGLQANLSGTTSTGVGKLLDNYASDAAFETANGGSSTDGNMYYNSSGNTFRWKTNSDWEILGSKYGCLTVDNAVVSISSGSGAFTIALKTRDGGDPAEADEAIVGFRSSTATSGSYTLLRRDSALSMTVSSGSTLGFSNSEFGYFYVGIADADGTEGNMQLVVSRTAYDETNVYSTTAEGGAGAADSATVIYSTSALTSRPIRWLCEVQITPTTAGTHTTSDISAIRQIVGDVRKQSAVTSAFASGGTTTSATYASFSNAATITFTARKSGRYCISATGGMSVNAAASASIEVVATAGSPTVIVNQEVPLSSAGASSAVPFRAFTIDRLTAGTAYTYELKGKTSAGTLSYTSVAALHLLAEEMD